MRKAFVLLSGGLDSTTCLYKAIADHDDNAAAVEAISINYGQRHSKEIDIAKATCEHLGIKHSTIALRDLLADENTMLTNRDIQIPNVSYSELPYGVSPTYVPNRNMVMLAVLTAHAQKWVNSQLKEHNSSNAAVYFGAHAEDAHNYAYPDCTFEFAGSMANAIEMASYHNIKLHVPLINMMKSEVVRLGHELGVPFENTWSCYVGETLHCGTCPTCRSRRDAFKAAEVPDPTEYAA